MSAALSVISTRLIMTKSSPSLRAKRSNPSRHDMKDGLLRRFAPRNDGLCFIALLSVSLSEEAKRLGAVAHQDVLGLLIMIQHHLVVLTADAGGLIAAEGGVRRIGVIAGR